MFFTLKSKLLLGLYVFLIVSIPIGAYLVSESKTLKSRASEGSTVNTKTNEKIATSSAKTLLNSSQAKVAGSISSTPDPSPDSSPEPSSPTIASSFGPTLSLKVSLEGRPEGNYATKLFVGIVEGALTSSPKFLLSFTVDLPKNGTYTNLSLAGLTSGNKYTALLKGSTQIATSSAFYMSPTVTNLNSGQAINMLTGDLNEDNVIDSSDLAIAQKALGSTPASANWNQIVDFNLDGVINSLDLRLINAHMNQAGDSGAWTSPIPKVSTPSASLNNPTPQGGMSEQSKGYWMWIPK